MHLFLVGLSFILFPIWVVLVILKTTGLKYVCSWKWLLIPIWVVLAVILVWIVVSIGFMGLVLLLEAVSK